MMVLTFRYIRNYEIPYQRWRRVVIRATSHTAVEPACEGDAGCLESALRDGVFEARKDE